MPLWPDVAKALGLSRNTVYEQAHRWEQTNGRDGIPVVRFGSRLRVPTAALRRLVGIDAPLPGEGDQHERDDHAHLRVVGGNR